MNFSNVHPGENCTVTSINKYHNITAEGNIPVELHTGLPIIITLTIIFIPLTFMIYKWRRRQAVYFKSPGMLIIGGIGFYIDSILTTVLAML